MKVGDLVKYREGVDEYRIGFITDVFKDTAHGHWMYEVIVTDPFDRGWFQDVQLSVVSEGEK